jgi:hypothetical protein
LQEKNSDGFAEGVTLSGIKDCKRMEFWRHPLGAGAEGARRGFAKSLRQKDRNTRFLIGTDIGVLGICSLV